jgi:putative ABC transport system permease protein
MIAMPISMNDLRIGWRLLIKEPVWSGVVIAGLSIGFATCFLLLGYVRYSYSYDGHIPEADRIYLVKTRFHFPGVPDQWFTQAPLALRDAADKSGVPVAATMFAAMDQPLKIDNRVVTVPVSFVDNNFAEVFGVQALEGDLPSTLKRPDALAITTETATKLFGRAGSALGRTVNIYGQLYTVTALLATPPVTTTVPYEALAGAGTKLWQTDDRDDAMHNWGRLYGRVYVKLPAATDPVGVTATLQTASDQSPLIHQLPPEFQSQLGANKLMDVSLVKLRDAYLDPNLAGSSKPEEHGNESVLESLATVAVLILLLACVNYVNLATVRTLRRQREIGVRKVLGAPVSRVIAQFISESVLVALIAIAVGLLLAWLALPFVASLVNRRLDGLFSPSAIAVSVVVAVLVGTLAGLYPAWVAAKVRPIQALAGRDNQEGGQGAWIRRALTVAQFGAAMGLTCVALAMSWQTWYASRLALGFDADDLLVVDVAPPFQPTNSHARAFFDAVGRAPGVIGVTQSLAAIGQAGLTQKTSMQREGSPLITGENKGIGVGYFNVHGVRVLAGREFLRGRDDTAEAAEGVVLSATATRLLGFAQPEAAVGQSIEVGTPSRRQQVLGVVSDIRHQSPREMPQPIVYTLTPFMSVVTIRVSDSAAGVQREVQDLWPQFFPDEPLKMTRASTLLSARYADDVRLSKLLVTGAFIAVVIAAFGIYVLSAYSVQRLAREIVIRKLHGAGPFAIVRLVSRELIQVVLVSAVIALPIAGTVVQRYISGFVERAPEGAWPIVLALIAGFAVAALAAMRNVSVAMALRPVEALRT